MRFQVRKDLFNTSKFPVTESNMWQLWPPESVSVRGGDRRLYGSESQSPNHRFDLHPSQNSPDETTPAIVKNTIGCQFP